MRITREMLSGNNLETVDSIRSFLYEGKPAKPEAILDLVKRKHPEWILGFCVDGLGSLDYVPEIEEAPQQKLAETEMEERFGKILKLVNRGRLDEEQITLSALKTIRKQQLKETSLESGWVEL